MMAWAFWELQVECIGPTAEIEAIFEQLLDANAIFLRKQDQAKEINEIIALFKKKPNLEQVDYYFNRCSLANIKTIRLQELPQKDWLQENRREFAPFSVGRFWVHGSHIKRPAPAGFLPLCVDAAQAFGSGTHATTRGCMLAIEKASLSKKNINRVLDLGCGSGILSMAAKSINRSAAIIAADYDKLSVETTRQNWHLNQFPKKSFFALHSDGFSNVKLRGKQKFDLIIANILAKPLRVFAPLIAQNLTFNGRVILSGLLTSQMRDIRAVYRHHHLFVMQHIQIEEWSTLILAPKFNYIKVKKKCPKIHHLKN